MLGSSFGVILDSSDPESDSGLMLYGTNDGIVRSVTKGGFSFVRFL